MEEQKEIQLLIEEINAQIKPCREKALGIQGRDEQDEQYAKTYEEWVSLYKEFGEIVRSVFQKILPMGKKLSVVLLIVARLESAWSSYEVMWCRNFDYIDGLDESHPLKILHEVSEELGL